MDARHSQSPGVWLSTQTTSTLRGEPWMALWVTLGVWFKCVWSCVCWRTLDLACAVALPQGPCWVLADGKLAPGAIHPWVREPDIWGCGDGKTKKQLEHVAVLWQELLQKHNDWSCIVFHSIIHTRCQHDTITTYLWAMLAQSWNYRHLNIATQHWSWAPVVCNIICR